MFPFFELAAKIARICQFYQQAFSFSTEGERGGQGFAGD